MTTVTQDHRADIAVVSRRHTDPATLGVEGMGARPAALGGDPIGGVTALYEQGARHILLPEPVDLSPAADGERSVRALVALREMTSRAIAVEWRLRLGPSEAADSGAAGGGGRSGGREGSDGTGAGADADAVAAFRHLSPPEAVTGVPDGADLLARWRAGYFFGACIYRRGPGFLQVRDRRDGQLGRITIDDPAYMAAVAALEAGVPADDLPAEILADLAAEDLIGRVGGYAWWTPCRVRRWPSPAMHV
ncbi:hypothetical protein GA0115240_100427 [Streptomyces sp. DvalAA-14]|uniref:DUF5825 family protein n=1 Tax=unclassified Streptomyces TaxID=2593676 RepID=UPI00081B6F40|nr:MULTISPECIES: DUF5825 family protein [unclassified Streptomyces]MYS18717.1 hypothetical protein [Streptomyces sp. SID4948]SCD28036.1 hypothetical protein GA0115240_100427 [Streptomyces sp. DvalAA-14]